MDQASAQPLASMRRKALRTVLAAGSCRTGLNEIARRLGNLGYLVVLGESAPQALELISARGFDLVLIDLLTPENSAIHLLNEIRGSRDTADLPVIVLGHEGHAIEAFNAGADDWLTKPFAFDE